MNEYFMKNCSHKSLNKFTTYVLLLDFVEKKNFLNLQIWFQKLILLNYVQIWTLISQIQNTRLAVLPSNLL